MFSDFFGVEKIVTFQSPESLNGRVVPKLSGPFHNTSESLLCSLFDCISVSLSETNQKFLQIRTSRNWLCTKVALNSQGNVCKSYILISISCNLYTVKKVQFECQCYIHTVSWINDWICQDISNTKSIKFLLKSLVRNICDLSHQHGHVGGMTPNWVIYTSLKSILSFKMVHIYSYYFHELYCPISQNSFFPHNMSFLTWLVTSNVLFAWKMYDVNW